MCINTLCEECLNGSHVRGIKKIKCKNCGENDIVGADFVEICSECQQELKVCHKCGEELE